jgi:hypothetical protein
VSDSINYAALFSGTGSSAADTIASLAAGIGAGAASSNPLTALQTAEQNETKDVAAVAQESQVQRVIASFTAAVASATSPAQLLQNPDVLNVLLTANNLGSQVSYTALAQKALLSDPNDPNSLVNQLTDTDWKTAAQTYQFATKGLSVIQNPQTIATLTQAYAEVQWRQSLDQTTPGLSNALDFRSRADTITSVDQILGDPTFRTVVLTALSIPAQIAFQPLEAQEQAVATRVDLSRFQDANYVDTLAQQYLVVEQQQAASTSSSSDLTSLAVEAQGLVV